MQKKLCFILIFFRGGSECENIQLIICPNLSLGRFFLFTFYVNMIHLSFTFYWKTIHIQKRAHIMNEYLNKFSQIVHAPVSSTQTRHRIFLVPQAPLHLQALPGRSHSPQRQH